MDNYSFPINPDWNNDEIVIVVNFLSGIEKAYTDGISRAELTGLYKAFKTVVTSISGEKQLDREFKRASGLSVYAVVKQLKNSSETIIKM
ncbi:UPF0223 family protein [Aerococcaceae bacterium DSM 111022]|nr:UPF0223 family protein [Aerococcaceae bacterium DSM 111022]MBG9989181.1 UPF0223 family protein [Aerococcaceae bacterium DSM 111176]